MIGRFSRGGAAAPTPAPESDAAQEPAATAAPQPAPEPAPSRRDQQAAMPSSQQVMLDVKVRLHSKLIEEIDLSKLEKLDEAEMRRQVRRLVGDFARAERLALNTAEIDDLGSSVYDEMVGLGPIEALLKDDGIADILINGPYQVYIERRGELELTAVKFRDNDHLLRIINRIVSAVGRRVDESS
ncbi:MAG: cpaF, partial [Caulobacteraceae bacterium]|nr:cpaF [Caulobacteraceae bacterium]